MGETSLYQEAKHDPKIKISELLRKQLGMSDEDIEQMAKKLDFDPNRPAGTMRRMLANSILAAMK